MRPRKVFNVLKGTKFWFITVSTVKEFYSVDLGLSANSGCGRKFRSSFILRTPYSYCNLVNSIAVKNVVQYFYLGEPNTQPTKAYLRSLREPNETVS